MSQVVQMVHVPPVVKVEFHSRLFITQRLISNTDNKVARYRTVAGKSSIAGFTYVQRGLTS